MAAVEQAVAPLVAWMAYAPKQQNWSPTEDLGALLHGFLTRFGTLFDCSKQCVNIGEVRRMDPCCLMPGIINALEKLQKGGIGEMPREDLGALLHGFLTRFSTRLNCSKQCVNIGEVMHREPCYLLSGIN